MRHLNRYTITSALFLFLGIMTLRDFYIYKKVYETGKEDLAYVTNVVCHRRRSSYLIVDFKGRTERINISKSNCETWEEGIYIKIRYLDEYNTLALYAPVEIRIYFSWGLIIAGTGILLWYIFKVKKE